LAQLRDGGPEDFDQALFVKNRQHASRRFAADLR
jgi:hypothetical protein